MTTKVLPHIFYLWY